MKKKIVSFSFLILLLNGFIFCEELNLFNEIFKSNGIIYGPVKTIITTLTSDNASSSINLIAEYLPDGRIQSNQFLELSTYYVNTITICYIYNISDLIAIECYADDNRLVSSEIITRENKILIFQNIYKSIFVDCVVDFDGRFLFYLLPSWVKAVYLYQIELIEFGWEAVILDENENILYKIKYIKDNDIESYFMEDYFLGINNKLELVYLNGNIIQITLYNMTEEYCILQTKYEYTSYDRYGNWLECIEENIGIKTRILREILYYESAAYEYSKDRYENNVAVKEDSVINYIRMRQKQ